ncbi:hypothetical protein LUZ63_010139 [Rhynchospora breviuscula]|uniref:DUF4005 domain-containing protein n=1 Tax=Rhynchospora breviuscula TaxID=2022672 RepID=A0A9Q0CGD0_9POAL|nr:hypothetical protein LUZ63_010139 [Rhynchospora breviuscula]
MGRASRWLANLLGWKKPDSGSDAKPKKWRFGKSYREKKERGGAAPAQAKVEMAEEKRGSYREVVDEEEDSKRAIAVAAATAVVAEKAVAAAQAAAVVVKLTSGGGRMVRGGARKECAAVKIQSVFRGYLARRALRALRALVRLQAIARGNIVRKQVAETLRCMHALVRVQARTRACRALKSERCRPDRPPRSHSVNATYEKSDQVIPSSGLKSRRSPSLKRNSSKPAAQQAADHGRSKSVGGNWLDQWIEDKYSNNTQTDDERSTKILEIDPGKPSKTPQKKPSNYLMASSCSTLTQPESPSKDSTTAQLSVPSPSTVDMAESYLYPDHPFSYSESMYYSATSRPGSSKRGAFTPSKSECSGSFSMFGGYTDYYPNYMTNTESSRAKIRSQSAPKQRPQTERLGSVKKTSALHLKFANKGYPGSGRLDRMGMPVGY